MFIATKATSEDELLEEVMEANDLSNYEIVETEKCGFLVRFRAKNPEGQVMTVMWNTVYERYNIKFK